jgi:Pvc16 N-terminal domain/Carboxypeptidase regulatory-like domain
MSDAAAGTMILADLDEVLGELLEQGLAARGLLGVTVTFEAPSRERVAQWASPAIDLFLYDLREAPGARDRSWHPTRVDGRAMLVRAPLRLACTYAITAWAPTVLDEHRLLSQVIAILCAHPQLPVELLPPSLLVGEPPQPLIAEVAHVRDEARAEFWTALGNQYKVSLQYTVTVLCDTGVGSLRGPAVQTEAIALQAGSENGSREESFTVAGQVTDLGGEGLAEVAVSVPALGLACVSDSDGRFVLRALPAGRHAVQARAQGHVASVQLTVPGDPLALTLPLSG